MLTVCTESRGSPSMLCCTAHPNPTPTLCSAVFNKVLRFQGAGASPSQHMACAMPMCLSVSHPSQVKSKAIQVVAWSRSTTWHLNRIFCSLKNIFCRLYIVSGLVGKANINMNMVKCFRKRVCKDHVIKTTEAHRKGWERNLFSPAAYVGG